MSMDVSVPAQWYAPLPHGGALTELTRWWQQFDDPLLVRLIDAAQAVSPSVASAAARIEQSRAGVVGAGAALVPTLDATASAMRGRPDFLSGTGSSALWLPCCTTMRWCASTFLLPCCWPAKWWAGAPPARC